MSLRYLLIDPDGVGSFGVYDSQAYGRAPKPLLGKAHTWCGGEPE